MSWPLHHCMSFFSSYILSLTTLALSTMPDSFSSTPISLYTIPLVWATALIPAAMRNVALVSIKKFNNVSPRANTTRTRSDKAVPPEVSARIDRMEAAHMNGNENLPLWAAAVLAANFAGLDTRTVNIVSIVYLVGRILFNYIYINQTTRLHGTLRSFTFFATLSLPLYLLFAAATKVAKAGDQ
ncbi:hypothetical protein FB45DRAFT_939656, partial [Roridomyces roridus]